MQGTASTWFPIVMKLAVLCVTVIGCGPTTVESTAPIAPVETTAGRYEVHEWGLVDVATNGSAELAAGPGQNSAQIPIDQPMLTRKPVLYFHLLEGEVQVQVRATMSYGAMLERFPATAMTGREVGWHVQVLERPCQSTTYPTVTSPACLNIADNYCEAAELRAYEAADASCLSVDGHDYNHLFYRGGGVGVELPVSIDSAGAITNNGAHAIPFALRIVSPGIVRDITARGRMPATTVTIQRFGNVAPGATQAAIEAIDTEEAIGLVRAELARLGLTDGEAQAFMNAWERPVFRTPNIGHALVYFLPAEAVNRISALAFEPAPETIKRAMMVRVER